MKDRLANKTHGRRFKQLVSNYKPLSFETFDPDDARFERPTHYVVKNGHRLRMALHTAAQYLPPEPLVIVDLGTYPGSLLRLLRSLCPSEQCRLIGVGLMISDEFRQVMTTDCGAEILTVNLDPKNHQLRTKDYPTRIPLEDARVQFIFSLEIIEHLHSPSHLLAEAFRILVPAGHLLITTPNVSRIGNVFKLVIGRSNFDRLTPLDYENPEDEWRPHFREYTLEELCGMMQRAGFEVVEARNFLIHDTRYNVKSLFQRVINLAKFPFYTVPHFRDGLLVVGRKPE